MVSAEKPDRGKHICWVRAWGAAGCAPTRDIRTEQNVRVVDEVESKPRDLGSDRGYRVANFIHDDPLSDA
jgi:hypothetical protein